MKGQSTPTISHFSSIIKVENITDNLLEIEKLGEGLLNSLGLRYIKKISHKFEPKGITILYLLCESHLAIHTWPEYKTIHIDLLSCKKLNNNEVEEKFKMSLKKLVIKDFYFFNGKT